MSRAFKLLTVADFATIATERDLEGVDALTVVDRGGDGRSHRYVRASLSGAFLGGHALLVILGAIFAAFVIGFGLPAGLTVFLGWGCS